MAKALPRNAELADQLDLLADLSEILDEESFKVIAYRRAATRIRESPLPVAELALDGKAKDLPGIGRTIENKVVEVVNVGEMEALTRRRQRVPAGVVENARDMLDNDEHLKARGYYVYLDHPETGRAAYDGPPFRLSKTPGVLRTPAPLLGQHNEQVCKEILGMSDEEIAEALIEQALY